MWAPDSSRASTAGENGTEAHDKNNFFDVYLAKYFELGYARVSYLQWNHDQDESFYASDDGRLIYQRETEGEDANWEIVGDSELFLGDHTVGAGFEIRRYGWGDQVVDFIDASAFNASINSPYFAFIKEGFKGQPKCLEYNAAYLQDRWRIHSRLDLEAGVRAEWFKACEIDPDAFGYPAGAQPSDLDEFNADPRIGIVFRPWDGGSVNGRFGIVHRYPNSPEYFWWYLNRSTDFFNTDLSVEKAFQYELGVEQVFFDSLTTRLHYYFYDINDYIASVTVPGTGQVVYNIGDVTVQGVELEVGAKLPYGFSAWANFTYQDSDKDDDPWDSGNETTSELPDLPEKMFNIGIEYAFENKFSAELFANYVDSREHFSGADLMELDSYLLLNFNARYRFFENRWSSWEAFFSAENITDQDYQEREGYPQPGATFVGGLRIAL